MSGVVVSEGVVVGGVVGGVVGSVVGGVVGVTKFMYLVNDSLGWLT